MLGVVRTVTIMVRELSEPSDRAASYDAAREAPILHFKEQSVFSI